MSEHAENLPDDPAVLKAMIAALQAENGLCCTNRGVNGRPLSPDTLIRRAQ